MRCKSCNSMIKSEIKDPISGDYSDLCGHCYRLSEYVRQDTFVEPAEYAHMGAHEGLTRTKNSDWEG